MASQSSLLGWGIGIAVVSWLVFGASQSKSKSKPSASSPRDATAAPASPLALPSSTPPLAYYSYGVKASGIALGERSTTITPPPNVDPVTTAYQEWVKQFGKTATHKRFSNGTGGLARQPWELDYVRAHYSQLPDKLQALWAEQEKTYAARSLSMQQQHKDFSPAPDKYSKQLLLVFRPEHTVPYSTMLAVPVSQTYTTKLVERGFQYVNWGWFPTDEYGRPYEGWGAGGGFDFLTTISMIGNTVLPYIPGYGTAANVALQATIAFAQGKSMKDIALTAARAALPAGAQYAFDLGVGIVLEGKDPKDALVDAAVNQLEKQYPGAKQAFLEGKAMAEQYTGKKLPGNVSGSGSRVMWIKAA